MIVGVDSILQYWMNQSGTVSQALYESGLVSIRTFYDEEAQTPRTVLRELIGLWMSIREAGPTRVDFWAYDDTGSYLGGFAIYGRSGQYYTGEIVGVPVHEWNQITGQLNPTGASWTGSFTLTGDTEDGLTSIQHVTPPEVADLIDGLASAESVAPNATPDRQAGGESTSLHRALTLGGLALLAAGGGVAIMPSEPVAASLFAGAAGTAFAAAQFLPEYAYGIRGKFGRDCPPVGSFFGETCAELTNLVGNLLSREEATPLGYVYEAMLWIKNAPSLIRDRITTGGENLANVVTGLLPGDEVGVRHEREPVSMIDPPTVGGIISGEAIGPNGTRTSVQGSIDANGDFTVTGTDNQGRQVSISGSVGGDGTVEDAGFSWGSDSGTGAMQPPATGAAYVMCAAPIFNNETFGSNVVYELTGWNTSPDLPYVIYDRTRTVTDSQGDQGVTSTRPAYCRPCRSTGTFSDSGDNLPCSSFHDFAQSEWGFGHQSPIETRNFDCLPQWPGYFCGN